MNLLEAAKAVVEAWTRCNPPEELDRAITTLSDNLQWLDDNQPETELKLIRDEEELKRIHKWLSGVETGSAIQRVAERLCLTVRNLFIELENERQAAAYSKMDPQIAAKVGIKSPSDIKLRDSVVPATTYILHWRYHDGSASGVIAHVFTQHEMQLVNSVLNEMNPDKSFNFVEVEDKVAKIRKEIEQQVAEDQKAMRR